jgi:hypothetical protein
MSISQHCKQRDRIKEDLKWKRTELDELEDSFNRSGVDCNFEEKGDIETLKEEIKDLEDEWTKLTGEQ